MELKDALKTALDFEIKGHKIYEEVSNKTENEIIARTFRYLADQELIHIQAIKEYMGKSGAIPFTNVNRDSLKGMKQFFNTTITEFKKKTELSDDDIKAHETGLELEKSSYDFYKEKFQNSKDPKAKKFFEWLMVQENAHYELIRNTYDFIKNPVAFYTEEERWMADGG